MVFFKINSKTIKQPSEITFGKEVLDKIERTMNGTMVVNVDDAALRVRLTIIIKYKWQISK